MVSRAPFRRVLVVMFFAAFCLSLIHIWLDRRILAQRETQIEWLKMAYSISERQRVEMLAVMNWFAEEQTRMLGEMKVRDIKMPSKPF